MFSSLHTWLPHKKKASLLATLASQRLGWLAPGRMKLATNRDNTGGFCLGGLLHLHPRKAPDGQPSAAGLCILGLRAFPLGPEDHVTRHQKWLVFQLFRTRRQGHLTSWLERFLSWGRRSVSSRATGLLCDQDPGGVDRGFVQQQLQQNGLEKVSLEPSCNDVLERRQTPNSVGP